MLAFLLAAVAAAHPDFTGQWTLDLRASTDPDALLKLTGASFLERQAARTLAPTQTIAQDGARLTLTVDATVVSRTEVLLLDGTKQIATGQKGETITTSTTWDGDALVTTSEIPRPDGTTLELVAQRTLEDAGATMRQRLTVTAPDGTVVTADRVFRRAPSSP